VQAAHPGGPDDDARFAGTNWGTFGSNTSEGRARVSSEPLTYEARSPHSFVTDLIRAERDMDMAARERLARHQGEMATELRDLSSTDGVGGELVPPMWLMSEYLPLARAGRPYASSINNRPLPQGTDSISLPKVLTGSATSAQADLGTVQETDPTTGSVTIPVKTVAGQVDVARQLLDRGAYTDDIVFGDLVADYSLRVDLQCLTGSGSGANAKGVLSDANRITVTWSGHTDGGRALQQGPRCRPAGRQPALFAGNTYRDAPA
jgi:HK97 family phage major capsid protein